MLFTRRMFMSRDFMLTLLYDQSAVISNLAVILNDKINLCIVLYDFGGA